MSSNEIEDVLSSIRRLVSEDFLPTPKPQIVSRMVVVDKLILTPALRVVSSGPFAKLVPEETALVQSGAVEVASVKTAPVNVGPVQAPSAAPRPALAPLPRLHLGADLEIAPNTPDVVAALSHAVDRQPRLDWDVETGDPEPNLASLDWSSFTFARRSMQETWIARTAAVKAVDFVAEAPVSTPDEVIGHDSDPDHIEFHDQSQDDILQGDEAAGSAYGPAVAFAKEDGNWADVAEAEVLANLDQLNADERNSQSPQPTVASEVIPGVVQEEDNIFSEQVLRELVRDLIREQLQGDLGERITRNIRKLVKAEIARALAVHALE